MLIYMISLLFRGAWLNIDDDTAEIRCYHCEFSTDLDSDTTMEQAVAEYLDHAPHVTKAI